MDSELSLTKWTVADYNSFSKPKMADMKIESPKFKVANTGGVCSNRTSDFKLKLNE